MGDIHCFDLYEVDEFVKEVRLLLPERGTLSDAIGVLGEKSFLPAPKTWLELRINGGRVGYLLCLSEDKFSFDLWVAFGSDDIVATEYIGSMPLDVGYIPQVSSKAFSYADLAGDLSRIYASLAIINTPRLIGRKQHMPHRGLERSLANAKRLVGKFPLHAWTELKLSISAMMKQSDGTEHEAHYTGERCLHFCRSHLRIREGRLEQVRSHWRGNPALGIKRTRYSVVA